MDSSPTPLHIVIAAAVLGLAGTVVGLAVLGAAKLVIAGC